MGQFKFTLWLTYWYLQSESFEFDWDDGNATKSLSKHGVTTAEVESMFNLKSGIPIGRQISPKVEEERLCIVGPSLSGSFISVVFTLRSGSVRPISSRPANRKERRLYDEVRKTLESIR